MTAAASSSLSSLSSVLLHRMVPEHFHVSELFKELAFTPETSTMFDDWHDTYSVLSDDSGEPQPKAMQPSPAKDATITYATNDATPSFEHTYWRDSVSSPEELDNALSTLELWRFPAIPEFVRKYCLDNRDAVLPLLRVRHNSSSSSSSSPSFAASLLAELEETEPAVQRWQRLLLAAVDAGGGAGDRAAMDLARRSADLAPADIAAVLEQIVVRAQQRRHPGASDLPLFLVAQILRIHPLPPTLPPSVYEQIGCSSVIALCVLRNRRNTDRAGVHAIVATALAAATAKRLQLQRTFGAYSPRVAAQCAAEIDPFWIAAAAQPETLRWLMARGEGPCRNDVAALAEAVIAGGGDDDVVALVAEYHHHHACCWAETAARHGRGALLRKLIFSFSSLYKEADEKMVERLADACVLRGKSDGADCLSAVLGWLATTAAADHVVAAARQRAVNAACRGHQEHCLHVLHDQRFTRKDLEAVFLAAIESTDNEEEEHQEEEDRSSSHNDAFFFVRDNMAPPTSIPHIRRILPAAATYAWAWTGAAMK